MTTQEVSVPAPAPHDGSTGNILQRAEPKVRIAGAVGLLTPIVVFYLLKAAPEVAGLPGLSDWADVLVSTLLTGVFTFLAGFLAKPVDRIDLFVRSAEAKLEAVGEHTLGKRVTDEVEGWVHDVHEAIKPDVAPVIDLAKEMAESMAAAAASGTDPIVAARVAAPEAKAALAAAAKQVEADAAAAAVQAAAQAATDVLPALEQAEAKAEAAVAPLAGSAGTSLVQGAASALNAEVSRIAADPNAGVHDLLDAMHKALSVFESHPTPIGDAARAAVPTSQGALPPVPSPAGPPAAEMPVIDPATGAAPQG